MKYILICFLSILAFPGISQDFDKAKMDTFFDAIDANDKGMGSVAIHHKGEKVYERAIGFEDLVKEKKATPDTKYRMGSISKTYTATIIMQLIEEEKLTLDTKLSKYFPDFENADQITIKHLLQHRSGLFNYTSAPDFPMTMMMPIDREGLIKKMMANDNVFAPGEKYEYCNTGYTLLGFIAEAIDDKEFPQIIVDRITAPHHLGNTYYGEKIGDQENEARSYITISSWQQHPEWHMSSVQGAGALVATPSDINVFFSKLMTGQIIQPSSVEMMKEMNENYGFALFEIPFYDRTAVGHNGKIDGFLSSASYFHSDSTAVCYISNGTNWSTNDILIGVLSIYYGKEYEIPDFQSIAIADDVIEKYLGVYSTPDFPLKITIAKGDGTITAQATGQSSFPLEPTEEHHFKFDGAGIKMSFDTEKGTMNFSQGGMKFEMSREED